MENSNPQNTIVEKIQRIIASKSNISYLSKTVVSGSIYHNKGFIANSQSIDGCTNTAWIRVVRLNKVFIKKYMEWKNEDRYYGRSYNEENKDYLSFFNNKYNRNSNGRDTRSAYMYIGSNIDRNIKLAGYHYNACDIYNSFIMDIRGENGYTNCREESKGITYYVYKFLFLSDKNFLVGMIDRTGILYLDSGILEKIESADQEKFKEIICNILSVYSNINTLFFQLNINGISGEIEERVKKLLFTGINDTAKNCSIIKPDNIDIFSDNSKIDNLISKMREIIKQEIRQYLDGTAWGIKNQYSFKSILDSIISTKYESSRYDIDKAFANGLLYGNKFELSGWTVSEKQFDNSVTWEKDVNIIPSRACYNKKLYIINNNDPHWKNPFFISKLYVTANGKMYCEGNHPNVSSQNVCMGDISGKIVLSDVKKLGENLNRCEALLTLINYDSAYRSSERDEIIKHSKLDPMNSFEIDKEYVGDNEVLTDVSYEEDETSDDIQVEPEDSNLEIINEEL